MRAFTTSHPVALNSAVWELQFNLGRTATLWEMDGGLLKGGGGV